MLENVFMQILDMTKTASVVIAVVFVARQLLKKAPKWISYALWGVVLLRLLCPISIEAPISAVPRMEQVSAEIMDSTLPRFEFETPADRQYNDFMMENPPESEAVVSVSHSLEPSQWLSFIWIAGIAVMLIYSAVSYIKLRRRLVEAALLRGNIYLADRISSPFVMGVVRPKIYMPSDIGEAEREYIILHEQCHIRRFDHIVKVLGFAALCVHWFNPLVWIAFVLAGKDMEMSCDEAVIKKLGVDIRADYSVSLLSLATGRRLIAGTPLAFGEGDTRGRIRNLAKWKKPVVWVVVIAVIVCVTLAVCLLTDPVDKRDTIELTERNSGNEIIAQFALDVGSEVKSGDITAELWQDGECVQSAPAIFTKFADEIRLCVTPVRGGEKYEYVDVQISTNQYNGSVLTRFNLPKYSGGLGWATMVRELNKKIKLQPETDKILLAVAFDMGGGVRALDCESLETEPERLGKYECILVIRANFSAEDLAPQQSSEVMSIEPIEVLQLHHVIKLAEKGYELGWEDFEDFYFIETRPALYVRVYEIDEIFTLSIEGGAPNGDKEPVHIYLAASGLDNRIDIRDGGVKEFIEKALAEKESLQDEIAGNKTFKRLAELTTDDIELIGGDFGRGIDPFAMAKALNGAPANRVARSEDIMAHWNVDVYTTEDDECLRLYAGAEENMVKLYHHTNKQEYTEWYFEDKMLYDTIRMAFLPLEQVDSVELAKYENILAARAEALIEEDSRLEYTSDLNGYEITEFYEHDRFENGDEQFVVYKWDVAFTAADSDRVVWAGGMWMDGLLRVRAYEQCIYFVVRTVDGEMQDYRFMPYDIYTGAGTDEERSRAWNEIQLQWENT